MQLRDYFPSRVVFAWSADQLLVCVLCGTTLSMMASTWRLWIPQELFPQVPLIAAAAALPRWSEYACVLFCALGAGIACAYPVESVSRRIGLCCSATSMVMLFLIDQHRLQPWAYHFAISAWALAFCGQHAIQWLRWLLISIYVYSAVGKLDATFLHTTGTLFVEEAGRLVGWSGFVRGGEQTARIAVLMPLTELSAAMLLAWPRCRRGGIVVSILMHLTLIMLLGPWGLNHRWAVLIWNLSCMLQVLVLFRAGSVNADARRLRPAKLGRRDYLVALPVIAALVLPMTHPFGGWDAWLSWGLYSSRVTKAEVFLAADAVPSLPASVRPYCEPAGPADIWVRCAMDRWSLDTLQAPLYPHCRFQIGVGLAVVRTLPTSRRWLYVITQRSLPDRLTGEVDVQRYEGVQPVTRLAESFRMNALPRPWLPELKPAKARRN